MKNEKIAKMNLRRTSLQIYDLFWSKYETTKKKTLFN